MALPDGIYDRLVDARLLEELKGLIDSGQVTLDRVLAGERPARLAAVISKLVAEALDEMEVEGEGDTRERAQLSVMSALLGSPELFHWQTQNSAGPDTKAGQRYAESPENGWRFFLFVRESRDHAYCALGQVSRVSIEGDRPMSVVWRFEVPLPTELFRALSVLRA